jgi:glucose-6-phosphate 1-dehydrogenase
MRGDGRVKKKMSATRVMPKSVEPRAPQDANLSNALVFFGATGDLAHRKIFPALQAMVRKGNLNVPVIGVAKAGWTIDQLKDRVRDSLTNYGGGVDEAAFSKLEQLLRYIDGDYRDSKTFQELRKVLGDAARPLHYLAIPPSMRQGCTGSARKTVRSGSRFGTATELYSAFRVSRDQHLPN